MKRRLIFIMTLFLLSCIFDPADTVLKLKVPLFVLCWLIFFVSVKDINNRKLPSELVGYIGLMIGLPIISIVFYYITNGAQPYEGFSLLKAHILISFSALLYMSGINLMKQLCIVLTIQSLLILLLYFLFQVFPAIYLPIYAIGSSTGIFLLDERVYSSDLKMLSIYFVTSPMIAIAIAYYFSKWQSVTKGRKLFLFLLFLNIAGLFLAGTRNNMLTAILLPVILFVRTSKYKHLVAIFSVFLLVGFVVVFWDTIMIMLDPGELSNQTKIAVIKDYQSIFSNPITLFFGQGIGAYYNWNGRGFNYVTELTYFEVIRNFGVIMGFVIIVQMFYPVIKTFYLNKTQHDRNIIIAYIFYLIMSATNPMFFSSLGMLILSIIMANIYLNQKVNTQKL